jgi:membrane-associated phospholipid phosphatase
MKRILFIFTRLFDPFAVITGMYLLIFAKYGQYPQDFKSLLFIILINIAIPISYFVHMIKSKRVGSWDVPNKSERRKVFGPLILFIGIATIIVYVYTLFAVLTPNGVSLFHYLLRFQVAGLMFFTYLYLVSPFFKSSGHVGTMTIAFLFILKMFGVQFSWVIILIGIQAVARVKLGKHTAKEVAAGFVSGMIVGSLVLFLL